MLTSSYKAVACRSSVNINNITTSKQLLENTMAWWSNSCVCIIVLIAALSSPGHSQFVRTNRRSSSSSSLTAIASSVSVAVFAVSFCIACCCLCYRLSQNRPHGVPQSRYTAPRYIPSNAAVQQQNQPQTSLNGNTSAQATVFLNNTESWQQTQDHYPTQEDYVNTDQPAGYATHTAITIILLECA